jgi:hypothetical protein
MRIYQIFGIKDFVSVELYDRTKSDLKDYIENFDFIFANYYIDVNNHATQHSIFLDSAGQESRIRRNGWQLDSIKPNYKSVGYEIRIQDPEGKTNWSVANEYKEVFFNIMGRTFYEGKYFNSSFDEYVLNKLLKNFKYFSDFNNWEDLVIHGDSNSELKTSLADQVSRLGENFDLLKTDLEEIKKKLRI